MNLIEQGIAKKLIRFDEEKKYITYMRQGKRRNYSSPEEQVQAETFVKLVLSYGYPVERIKQFVSVAMGASTKEADIIVYNDDECTKPHIVVECKKEGVSELEFIQAIEQAAAYAYAISGTIKYIWITSRIKDETFLIDKESNVKQTTPDIPRFGESKIQKYKHAKGGRKQNEEVENDKIKQQFFELETIGEAELTSRFKQAHNSLWGGGELNPSEAFDELDKLIFCKIWDERKKRKKGEPYDFQIFNEEIPKNATSEQIEKIEYKISTDLYKRVKALYDEGKKKDPEVFKDNIRLSHQKVKTVVGYLEAINLSDTDLDSKGKAFETFMGNYFRGDFGQYFTPRPIVKFIVNSLPITNDSRVLDTSCGSGGFLLYALDKVRQEAGEYHQAGTIEHYKHWHDFAEKKLFGIEINEQIARTAKMNMIIHDDGHTNVISSDGLLRDEEMQQKSGNKQFKYNSFDFIITNPPFGSKVKQTEKAYLHQYGLGKKETGDFATKELTERESKRANQSTEVLFIEQCHNFLNDNGFLAIVIPDGVLTNSSLQYVRNSIEDWFRIVAVVSMPQTAFAHTGAGVKSSVLFLRKWKGKKTQEIKNLKQTVLDQVKTDNDFLKTIAYSFR
ncbi:MAG: restriction endonuclease subunit M [Candidatus Cloacimonetes bacterium]|jgi:type I restriction enzyme M protein|nr:restriction endonuclease subunit M [Candidatus Cloacimonadota bacterium]